MLLKLLLHSTQNWSIGFLLIRIMVGIFIMPYGLEIFNQDQVNGYSQWLTDLHFPLPKLMAYLGKLAELLGGICLILGLLTRPAALVLAWVMFVITFIMGNGKIFTDVSFTFLFMLMFLLLACTGAGRWSLDHWLFNRQNA